MSTVHVQMSLKERQRREREALILQVAEEVFAEKGYYDTSMDEIAARVGIAKGTVYLHFPGKEALVMAIFTREMETFLEKIEVVVAAEGSPRAKLEMIFSNLFTGMHRKRTQLLSNTYNGVDLQRLLSEHKGRLHELWERLAASITTLLEEGKACGELKSTLPTSVMLLALFSLLSPHVSEHLIVKDGLAAEDLVGMLGSIFFDGITEKDSPVVSGE